MRLGGRDATTHPFNPLSGEGALMSHAAEAFDDPVAPAHVWASLAIALQGQASWLLTQWAMNGVTAYTEPGLHKELPSDSVSCDQ